MLEFDSAVCAGNRLQTVEGCDVPISDLTVYNCFFDVGDAAH